MEIYNLNKPQLLRIIASSANSLEKKFPEVNYDEN